MSPGTMVHAMHVLFMFSQLSSFLDDSMPIHALDVFIENATKMVLIIQLNTKNEDQTLR